MKILGDDAEVPELPDTIKKANEAVSKAYDTFIAARDELEAKLLELDDANSGLLNAAEQFRSKIGKNDFKHDPKADAKTIDQARKLLLGDIDGDIGKFKKTDKAFDDLDRHLAQLWKYKQDAALV